MATRKAAKAEHAQSDVVSTKREAAATVLNILGRWAFKLQPHGQPGVEMSFPIFIKSGPSPDGVFEGSLVDIDDHDLPGGRLIGVLLTPANIMFFKVSVSGLRYTLCGTVTGAGFPLKFNGSYIRNIDGGVVMAEPGETGTGGGSQGT